MKISMLKRYDAKWGGNKLSAFYGVHTFGFGGQTWKSIHFWPFHIEWEVA